MRSAVSGVGRAILMTSLTTMIGFGSIGFYDMPGMASMGVVLFLGVGACLVSTLLVMPALAPSFDRWLAKSPMARDAAEKERQVA